MEIPGQPAFLKKTALGLWGPIILVGVLLAPWSAPAAAQVSAETGQIHHDVRVINIEIPVRVFNGNTFVEDLGMNDFEVYENGVLQNLQAAYLVKKAVLEPKGEMLKFSPNIERHFLLFFMVYRPDPKINQAIDFFVENILRTGDSLTVVTSVKTYRMKRERLLGFPKEILSKQLSDLVERDTLVGNTEYLSILDELSRMLTGGKLDTTGVPEPDFQLFGEGSWEEFLMNYRDLRERLEDIRTLDADRLLAFPDYLRNLDGQKIVLVFYQNERVPMLNRNKYIGQFEDAKDFLIEQDFKDLFDLYKRDKQVDSSRITRAYSDASITVHFLFVTKSSEPQGGRSPVMEEHSEDIFGPLLDMAKATGGLAASSSNPEFLMKKSGEAVDNYYLLYYVPADYRPDGGFREIAVKVKGKNYSVLHRAGYVAK